MQFATWNILHDGCIKAIKGEVLGDLQITVEMEYICEELPTREKHLLVCLNKCAKFEYRRYDEEESKTLAEAAKSGIEILGAKVDGPFVAIFCGEGTITAAYEGIQVFTAEGKLISQSTLGTAAQQSVDKFMGKNTHDSR